MFHFLMIDEPLQSFIEIDHDTESLDITLSDHADWQGILDTVRETGASRVLVSHGHESAVSRYLREEWGIDALPQGAAYGGSGEDW